MIKVFIDTNVILDVLLEREGSEDAKLVLQLGVEHQVMNCTSVLSFVNLSYILRKYVKKDELYGLMDAMFDCLSILPMGDQQVYDALSSRGPDFEDSLQIICARHSCCDLIITSDKKHFKDSPIPVYTPSGFLAKVLT